MSEREPFGFACESCGKDLSEHLGLVGTCRQLEMYRKLHNHALDCVDIVFQDEGKRKALLSDFLQLGDDKFDGVVKLAHAYNKLTAENARLLKRVDDLEQAIANGMNDATRFVDRNGWLESEHERLKQENERLRGLLREYKHKLDKRWREGTRVDSYARGHQDGLEAAEVIFDDVFKAELAKGE